MSEIDEVSRSLGKLEMQSGIIMDSLKRIDEKLTIQNGSIAKAHGRLDTVAEIANDWKVTKRRGVMAIIGLGAAGGTGATGLLKALAAIIGGGS